MIKNIATHNLVSRAHNMISILNDSDFEFHLTGSRFFGMSSVTSDYDFVTEDSQQVRDFLISHGFEPVENKYSDDKLTCVVFRLAPICCKVRVWDNLSEEYEWIDNGTGIIVHGNEGFDIQVTKHLDSKLLIQSILKEKYPCGLGTDKAEKANLWKLVLHTLQYVNVIPKVGVDGTTLV